MTDDIDDFMDDIGLDVKPVDAEDAFMLMINGGNGGSHNFTKVMNLRFWLKHEMYGYFDLLENGCVMMRHSVIRNELVPFTQEEYVNNKIKYWLRMCFLSWFNSDMKGFGRTDINKIAAKLAEHPQVVDMATAKDKKSLPPRN